MNALYRPGPMEYIPSFIARKFGREAVTYDIPDMEEYLKDTYGITVYQEQVMLLSQKLAGFTGGQADTLRKAMGKKKKDVLDKMKPQFIEGAKKMDMIRPSVKRFGETGRHLHHTLSTNHTRPVMLMFRIRPHT